MSISDNAVPLSGFPTVRTCSVIKCKKLPVLQFVHSQFMVQVPKTINIGVYLSRSYLQRRTTFSSKSALLVLQIVLYAQMCSKHSFADFLHATLIAVQARGSSVIFDISEKQKCLVTISIY